MLEASNGKIACEMAMEYIPDLVITDLIMPEMNGIELCQFIKNEILTQHIPVIILSARGSTDDMLEGLVKGADDYLSKPFNEQILLAKIQTMLFNRQKLNDKFTLDTNTFFQLEDSAESHYEDPLVNRIIQFISENISDSTLDNEKIENHFRTSKMQLYRKLKAVTGLSVNNLIKEIRIRRASQLLRKSEMNISEIAYAIGFSDPLYFSKFFKKEVGTAPKYFRQNASEVATILYPVENSAK